MIDIPFQLWWGQAEQIWLAGILYIMADSLSIFFLIFYILSSIFHSNVVVDTSLM